MAGVVLIVLAAAASLAVESLLGNETVGPDAREIERLSVSAVPERALAGQKLMVRMNGSATPDLMRQARKGEVGGVIAFPPLGQPEDELRKEIARLQEGARDGRQPPLLVATDQEGGEIKRLPEGPPDSSPAELGAADDDAEARAAGRETGRYLSGLGINVDLAPVLDVPSSEASFISGRAFGTDPAVVAAAGVAFAEGLEAGGVIPAAKHFPGLGSAVANTDLEASTVDAPESKLSEALAPFRDAIAAGVPIVMIGHAVYRAFDPERPAALSPQIVGGLLRADLGFEGVVMSDDLGAGAVRAAVSERKAPVAAALAGIDVLLLAQTGKGKPAVEALLDALARGELSRTSLEDSYLRILDLKESIQRL